MPIMTGSHAPKDLPAERVTDRSSRRACHPGDLGVVPGAVEHEAWFPEDTDVIDVFSPPRADFMPGTAAPSYMQEG